MRMRRKTRKQSTLNGPSGTDLWSPNTKRLRMQDNTKMEKKCWIGKKMHCDIINGFITVYIQDHFFSLAFFITSFAWSANLPSLNSFAASKFMATPISGCKSILWMECTISDTFLFGSHYFYPSISWQMSPSFTFGCQMGVLNRTTGNLNGNCSGKSISTSSSPPSYGDPTGPLIKTSQWNKLSFCLHTTFLWLIMKYSSSILLTRSNSLVSLFISVVLAKWNLYKLSSILSSSDHIYTRKKEYVTSRKINQ